VQRVAQLVAQWMAAGFCHAVLNTDNMSITVKVLIMGLMPLFRPMTRRLLLLILTITGATVTAINPKFVAGI
jgi:hypothetical protein